MKGSRKILELLFNKQGGICNLCEQPMELSEASIDHVIPQKFGGRSGPKTAVHKICNSIKGHSLLTIPVEVYIEKRTKILNRLIKKTKNRNKKTVATSRTIPKSWLGAGVIMDDTGKLFFSDSV